MSTRRILRKKQQQQTKQLRQRHRRCKKSTKKSTAKTMRKSRSCRKSSDLVEVRVGSPAITISSSSVGNEETGSYNVEAIVDYRIVDNNQSEYLVKWEGFQSRENTWEPVESLTNCRQILRQFFDENKAEQVAVLNSLKQKVLEKEIKLNTLERLKLQAKAMNLIT